MPRAVAHWAETEGTRTWACVPRNAELTEGWRNITFQELYHAMDGMARWLDQNTEGVPSQKVISYMGLNDVRYAAVELGIMKTGNLTMLPSLRNSQEGQVSLFKTTNCELLLYSEGIDPFVKLVASGLPSVRTLQVPSFDTLCELGARNPKYEDRYNDAEDANVLILHTSGSTGVPKPIFMNHGGLAASTLNFLGRTSPPGRTSVSEVILNPAHKCLHMSPFYHKMGHYTTAKSILIGQPFVLLPVGKPPSAVLVKHVLDQTKPSSGLFAPAILEQMVELPGGLESLAEMETVCYGGGPLGQGIGNQISKVTRLITALGSTEAGMIASLVPADTRDWMYFEWDPVAGIEMQPESDGLYEMVIKPTDRRFQKVFHTFPLLDEWRTKDLFSRHPTKPELWSYIGRKDDVLVLSNGEKVQPVDFETRLVGHKLISGAVMIGQGRFQTGLLVEPNWDCITTKEGLDELLAIIWPTIVEGNKILPEHGQIWKSKVAFSTRNKPFARAGKGTVIRRQTNNLYRAEIEALYANEDSEDQLEKLPSNASLSTTKDFIRKALKVKGLAIPEHFPDNGDIFSCGVDSLQVLALTVTLNHAIGPGRSIRASAVYQNPTISSLAVVLMEAREQVSESVVSAREKTMTSMIHKYTTGLPTSEAQPLTIRPGKHTVILTGSTGALGNHILQTLIISPSVGKIFCLNRSHDAEERQRLKFTERGVEADFSKVSFLHTDFSKDRFGLSSDIYKLMLDVVDVFIHNAWAVDFNKALSSYEEVHIAGTRRCVDFSLASKFRAHIVFISSIASVTNWSLSNPGDSNIPERLIEDHSLPASGGYGESKHVASFILAAAAKVAGVPSTIIRSGQITGASGNGNEWNRHEWFPSLILSSRVMGVLPAQLGNWTTIDWVPVDIQAQAIVEIAEVQQADTEKLRVAHLVNPRTVTWADLLPTVHAILTRECGRDVKIVPYTEWVRVLKALPVTRENAESIPGIKLIEFYESMSVPDTVQVLETRETAKISPTVADMKPIDSVLMAKWMDLWFAKR